MTALGRYLWRLLPGNPMVLRIVYGGSRRWRHFFVRVGYLGVLVGIVLLGLLTSNGLSGAAVELSELAQSGSRLFLLIAYGQVIGVCLLAPVFMAGAIAGEQAGRTYNILLTTPMSNLQIVLGSLFGRLFFVLALLLSGLPLFAVLLVFGGVRSAAVFQAFAIAGCTALSVGAVAITLSVLRAGGRKAVFVFVIAIASYLVGGYVLDRVLLQPWTAGGYTTWLTPAHPLLVLESLVWTTSYAPWPVDVWAGWAFPVRWWFTRPFEVFVGLSLLGSVGLIAGCSVVLRRMGQGAGSLPPWLAKVLRLHTSERSRPARTVTGNPVAWREANTRGKFAAAIFARFGLLVASVMVTAVLLVLYHRGELTGVGGSAQETLQNLLLGLVLLQVAVIALVAVYMSAGCVSKEREDGTLDIFLTTPITPKQYIWGKLRGLVRFLGVLMAAPVATLLIAGGYTVVGLVLGWPGATYQHRFVTGSGFGGSSGGGVVTASLVLPESGVLMALMLVPFVALCVAIGMWRSLGAKTVLGALVPVVVIGGAVLAVVSGCGTAAAGAIPLVGPVIAGLSPVSGVLMLVKPYEYVSAFAESPWAGRVSLWIAALVAAGGYFGVVWALINTMVNSFDQTVRRLSGTG